MAHHLHGDDSDNEGSITLIDDDNGSMGTDTNPLLVTDDEDNGSGNTDTRPLLVTDDDLTDIESDHSAELYDSDATDISEDGNADNQVPRNAIPREPPAGARIPAELPGDAASGVAGDETQTDSESVFAIPERSDSNQTEAAGPSNRSQLQGPNVRFGRTHDEQPRDAPLGLAGHESQTDSESVFAIPERSDSNQIEAASRADQDEGPGPSNRSQPQGPNVRLGTHDAGPAPSATNQSTQIEGGHVNDNRTQGQSRNRAGNGMEGSSNERAGAVNTDVTLGQSQGLPADDRQVATAQEPGHADEVREEEPMEIGDVAQPDESSNDSMSDFQEPKKPVISSPSKDDSSDDESQTCSICYESWTTSGSHRIVSLRCGHLFGQSCIEQWLKGQGGKCPHCNAKAKKSDVRVIYARALKALDTSERDRALKELEKEKEMRKKAEMEAAQTQLKYTMALEEVKRIKAMLESQQRNTRSLPSSGATSSSHAQPASQSSGHYVIEKTISVSPNGNCRVLGFDVANQILLASMASPNQLFQGFGLKKISAMDFKTCQYIPIHSKPIRGIASNGRQDGLILSASVDKTLKITSLASNTVVQTYTCPMPAWCCAWNSANTNYVYAGLQNGGIVIFDTRQTNTEVQTLNKEGSRCPIVALNYVPSSTRVSFPCAGLLTGTLEGASFWEQLSAEEYRFHPLQLEGSCTSVTFEPSTRHCLASFRPKMAHPSTRYVMCELKRQLVGGDGNSLVTSNSVQTFYGGTTMKLLTRSAMFRMPGDDAKLIVCAGDEASSSLYVWEGNSGALKQKIPIAATALDICPFTVGQTDYLAALTDKQLKLCKWVDR